MLQQEFEFKAVTVVNQIFDVYKKTKNKTPSFVSCRRKQLKYLPLSSTSTSLETPLISQGNPHLDSFTTVC